MIISASRRTDIPAKYSEWFMNRIQAEYALVRNPFNPHQINRRDLSKNMVDCIVFWTRNAAPMMPYLDELDSLGYKYYFQFTLTGYGTDLEPNLPDKDKIIETFISLSQKIGREKVIWRYDPIMLTDKYTALWHIKMFKNLCEKLSPFTEKCVISFVDLYEKTKRNTAGFGVRTPTESEIKTMVREFIKCGLLIETCAENIDLSEFGIKHTHCIDGDLIARIIGQNLHLKKDKSQRAECGCMESKDIGMMNSCPHGCLYCYANQNANMARQNAEKHNPNSPLLFGEVGERDKIFEPKEQGILF
ncbi:MAG: DUF1848 domain-containing protein [Rickettsiales bacterium]|jgi:hypothetical protein|nr:DUF1848 domain-containing protein [Rickettsiales bacterium]